MSEIEKPLLADNFQESSQSFKQYFEKMSDVLRDKVYNSMDWPDGNNWDNFPAFSNFSNWNNRR